MILPFDCTRPFSFSLGIQVPSPTPLETLLPSAAPLSLLSLSLSLSLLSSIVARSLSTAKPPPLSQFFLFDFDLICWLGYEMGTMEADRPDGRTPNQLRPLACSRNLLHRAHGSARWSQGDTIVLAAVYGPKAGTRKGENPEKASIEVIWKPKTGQIGNQEKEYEMILKRTVQSICLLNIHPNTTTSVIVQIVGDDGALLPCAINASCAALVDAGIPLKHLAVAICCGLTDNGSVILDPTLVEEQKMQAFAYLAFPNSPLSVIPKSSYSDEAEPIKHGILTPKSSCSDGAEPIENGIITSVTHGAMSVGDYFNCVERGRAACARISEFLRRSFQSQVMEDSSKAT